MSNCYIITYTYTYTYTYTCTCIRTVEQVTYSVSLQYPVTYLCVLKIKI